MEHDKRVVIYPAYIDVKKTVAQGRRVSKSKACENPTAMEVVDCCNMGLKLRAELEAKTYCRDFLQYGRARIRLFDDDGKPANPSIPNRKVLYEKVAELCPRHPGRSERAKQLQAKQQAAAASSSAAPASKQSGKSGKKKRK
ncbi:g3378 [Coccomyxa viridis]|uniref:G3378 protein n=1 Tax=Coccomyxa viridis TaxID=1274662 RepID=A0ABP1FQK8_9CHLO